MKPWLYRAIGLAVVLYIAYLVREIWLPLILAFIIAMILDPVVDRLERRGFTRLAGAALIFGGFIVVFAGLLFVSIPPLIDQGTAIENRIAQVLPDQSPNGIDRALQKQGASPMVRSMAKAVAGNAKASFDRSSSVLTGHLIEYASNLIWLVIVPIVAFYTLRDFHVILGKLLLLVKQERRSLVQSAVSEVTAIFAKYMRGLLIVSSLNGLATWFVLALLRVPSSFVLGVIAGVLYSVPYLGALITVALIAVVSFLSGGLNFMLAVLGCMILLHQIVFDQIISPRILGRNVGLHPVLAIVALLAGNALLGLLGMILAVPVAACIQIGVLAMVPKLKQEIQFEQTSTTKDAADSKESHLKVDATEELHQSVTDAIETIEKEMPKQDARRSRILNRRKSRAADTGP